MPEKVRYDETIKRFGRKKTGETRKETVENRI